MRIGFNFVNGLFDTTLDDFLAFSAQYGATDVVLQSSTSKDSRSRWSVVPGDHRWELPDLECLRKQVESYGLHLEALENVPSMFYDRIMLGDPGRDEQIENMIYTVRNIARAGIPIFGYNWMPSSVWRTSTETPGRGGSKVTSYDHSKHLGAPFTHGREYSEEEMWENLEYWIKIITPVAEEEGIRLGILPADPPVPSVGGIPRLLTGFEAYRRLIEMVDSPSNAIEFCQGTFAEMPDAAGDGIYDMIRYFGERNRILYVHFRNVSNAGDPFHEEFINTGHVDMYRAMKLYREIGFDGVFVNDHVPNTIGDTDWGHRGRAYANGYIQAIMDVVDRR
ncbi:MAG: mannonate dehydratase [Chloroflexi bacterium]|nr:mannonate dehydratase [Chloroflexota bacterium]